MTQSMPIIRRRAPASPGDKFNPFLFAFAGTDRLGGQLGVISALARLDLDAWAQATALACLPRGATAANLSALPRRSPGIPHIVQDSGGIARLIVLLPGQAAPCIDQIAKPAGLPPGATTAVSAAVLALIMFLGFLCFSDANSAMPPAAGLATTATLTPAGVPPVMPPR